MSSQGLHLPAAAPPAAPGKTSPTAHVAPAAEIFSGWIQIKTQSYVNMRPRHVRYAVLAVNPMTPASLLLYTFKFQPSSDELHAALVDPVAKTYSDLKFVPWEKRTRGFFLHALDKENRHCVLEIDVKTAELYEAWVNHLTSESSRTKVVSAALERLPKKKTEIWHKGASIHRGLENGTGENNCFLNVIIQSFWHLVSLRRLLLDVTIKENDETQLAANVLRTLKETMMSYEDPSSGSLHPKSLRQWLSILYKTDKTFEEGSMADAEETLLTILHLMHQQSDLTELTEAERDTLKKTRIVASKSLDGYEEKPLAVFDPKSIPHIVFSHQIYDRSTCQKCHESSPWELCSNLVFSIYTTTALSMKKPNMAALLKGLPEAMSEDLGTCHVEACNGKLHTERVIHRFPPVFAMSLLWSSNNPPKEDIQALLGMVSDTLNLADAFVAEGEAAKLARVLGGIKAQYRFRGFVCYYGRHYFAFFYSTAHQLWLLFDDNKVTDIGNWTQVVDHCVRGRYQPVLLFYEVPDARKDSSISLFKNETVKKLPDKTDEAAAHATGKSMLLAALSLGKENVEPLGSTREATAEAVVHLKSDGSLAQFVQGSKLWQNITAVNEAIAMPPRTNFMTKPCQANEYDVEFPMDAVVLGLYLEKVEDDLCVTAFPRTPSGETLEAEASGRIALFDTLVMANGHPLGHYTVDRALKMIQGQTRPLRIRFKKSQRVQQLVDMGLTTEQALKGLHAARGNIERAAEYCFSN
ncbi:Aste57867_9365 [Aphanomyces stellatus]|uniref:Aste57867_9365 protein n=1 Tax=Aphanomyces stellatus TaxID=120398 RepID=A0A485KN51_9STRA|nr:hypothetical protein As57867_009329 [Aphanomyces stellatus]VFT86246.1 Aste57867_9365 [Aphanomyces stellatus]